MSMFPTAGATVYRNEDGEPIGWDTPSEPDYADMQDAADEYAWKRRPCWYCHRCGEWAYVRDEIAHTADAGCDEDDVEQD